MLDRGICVASALALLVAVMTAPIRSPSFPSALFRPDAPQRDFTHAHSSRHAVKSIGARSAYVKALRSETEEEKPGRAACPAWCFFRLPSSSPSRSATPGQAVIGLLRVSQPLRC